MIKIISAVIISALNISIICQENSIYSFKNVESVCYCNASESTPNAILKMDNNWEIVYALIQPKTRKQMDSAGIKYSESQLKLLENWKIITKPDDSSYKTSIPVLDSLKTILLRQYSLQFSGQVADLIKEKVIEIKQVLKNIGRERNTYSILFSYILDGMVWDYLDEVKVLPAMEISGKNPFWAGEFWLLYPKRNFQCGTNSISDKGISIKVNWSEKAIPNMKPFVSRWDLLGKMLEDLITKNKLEDKDVFEVFKPYNIFDQSGNFTVPVITENNNNALYKISGEISRVVKTFLTTEIDFENLKTELGFNNNSQAIIILYHEMLWDMLDIMEAEGLIKKPLAFSDPENSQLSDISDLVIITKK